LKADETVLKTCLAVRQVVEARPPPVGRTDHIAAGRGRGSASRRKESRPDDWRLAWEPRTGGLGRPDADGGKRARTPCRCRGLRGGPAGIASADASAWNIGCGLRAWCRSEALGSRRGMVQAGGQRSGLAGSPRSPTRPVARRRRAPDQAGGISATCVRARGSGCSARYGRSAPEAMQAQLDAGGATPRNAAQRADGGWFHVKRRGMGCDRE